MALQLRDRVKGMRIPSTGNTAYKFKAVKLERAFGPPVRVRLQEAAQELTRDFSCFISSLHG